MGRLARGGAVLALTLAMATTAFAHGGGTVLSGTNASYKLTVQAIDIRLDDGQPAVDLTAYPIRRANGAPDLNAEVVFKLGTREMDGHREGDGITAEIPIEKGGAWRYEPISASVSGAAGTITATAAAQLDRDSGPPAWLYPVTAALIVPLIAIAIVRRRNRA